MKNPTNKAPNKPRVIIVGAGLAGLAAAYELLKTGKYIVDIFEASDRIGGRVQTLQIQAIPIDVGGFIIYPWYEEYHRLINELNIGKSLEAIAMRDIFYEIGGPGKYVHDDDIPFPPADTVKLWIKLSPRVLLNTDIAEPRLDFFYDKTISQYMRELLGRPEAASLYETFTDIISQGYGYGPVNKYRAAFITPIIRYTKLHGDISSAFYYRQGNAILPQSLGKYITDHGGTIHCNSPVTNFYKRTISTPQGEQTADAFVFAQPVTPELYSQILPNIEIDCSYTTFYTAVLHFNVNPLINNQTNWGAVFYKPEPTTPYQILSSINLRELYSQELDGYITVNVRVLSSYTPDHQPLTSEQLFEQLQDSITKLFPDAACNGVSEFVYWSHTMPIATEPFVQAVRNAQGNHALFFAGDYLGGPSMETALKTGVRAAQAIQNS